MALFKIVARLSVITMESVRSPAAIAAGEFSGMHSGAVAHAVRMQSFVF